MDNPIFVSIVMPLYKPNFIYLKATLDSIANQDYRFFEVVISDDELSPSIEVRALLDSYKNLFHLHYITNETDHGIFGNLNNALKWVKGDLIQFFCQDDIMHEDFIKKQVVDFDANGNVGMVFSAFSEIDDQGNLLKSKSPRPFNPKHNLFISTQEASDYFIKFGCFQGNLSPVMLRKEVFKRSGYFNSELKYAGDFEYWVRLSTDFGMYYRNEIGLEVRHHANRASSILSNHQLLHDLIFIYGVLLNRFSEKERQQRLGWVNKVVGVQFVHHALKQVITLKWPLKSLLLRYKELNSFPFKATKAMSWYLVLLPYRFWMRVYFAFKA